MERRSDLPEFAPARPAVDVAQWRLVVDGAVEHPLSLTWDDLQAMPQVAVTDDFRCLEGWVVPDNHWRGVALAAVLWRAGLQPAARFVLAGAGDYTALLTREQAENPAAVLAHSRNGQALTHAHGAPLRLNVPGADCFVQVKWVERLTALVEPVEPSGPDIAMERLGRGPRC